MLSTGAFLQALVPLYIIAAIGFASRKMRILNSNANQVMTQLMLYITLPALILYSLNTTITTEQLTDFAWLVAMPIFILASWLRRIAALPEKMYWHGSLPFCDKFVQTLSFSC